MKVYYISALLDINRKDWNHWSRSVDDYFKHFNPFIKLFSDSLLIPSSDVEYFLILYIDDKHLSKIQELPKNIILIPINFLFMEKNIHAWSRLKEETEVMASEYFKKCVLSHDLPEFNHPMYTLVNHSKIDFVCHALNNVAFDATCACWVDFGFFQKEENIPKSLLDVNKLDCERINYQLLNPFVESDKDILSVLKTPVERIAGSFFFGNRKSLFEYQRLYHEMHSHFLSLGVCDDDQHLAQQVYFKNPDLFRLHLHKKWHTILLHIQREGIESLTDIMNKYGTDKGSGWHNYTEFYEKLFGESLRSKNVSLLEIGIGSIDMYVPSNMRGAKGTSQSKYFSGASLRGWRDYFPLGNIFGCDIDKKVLVDDERITTFYMDQRNENSIRGIPEGRYDIIIDDGLHSFRTNIFAMKILYEKLNPGGFYIIEGVIDFDESVLKDDFFVDKNVEYYRLGNANNRVDNNLLVIRKSLV